MAETNSTPYGAYGKHESSEISIGKERPSAKTLYPGSAGKPSQESHIKHVIKTTGGDR